MGLRDILGGKGSRDAEGGVKLNGAEAFAAIAIVAMAADGYATDEEMRMLGADLYRMELFRKYSDEQISNMLDKLLGIIQEQGADALFHSARPKLPEDLEETAYAIAADLVLTDGELADEEKVFLDKLREELQIPAETAEMLVKAMLIKNRG